ncbi:apolipoprotein A-I-like [Hyperolius riggenbachi]|uniref:apolipoprotein A-I-like n=1 Tax=Hyperolius riggenbachi TaxID=752182 RepID=UPI0035A2F63F
MKVLLLCAVLLLCTGVQGRSFWQSDEPHPKSDNAFWTVLENAYSMIKVAADVDYGEIAKEYHLKEKLEDAKTNFDKLERVVDNYIYEVRKKYDEKLTENFPVFKEKVYPHLDEFGGKVEKVVTKVFTGVVPVTSELAHGLKKQWDVFCEHLKEIAEKARDKLREDMDDLRGKVQPHAEEMKAEYEKYKEGVKEEFDDKLQKWKHEVDKEYEKVREHLKPYAERVQSEVSPRAKELYDNLQKLLKAYSANEES